jgi:hypothetical protein
VDDTDGERTIHDRARAQKKGRCEQRPEFREETPKKGIQQSLAALRNIVESEPEFKRLVKANPWQSSMLPICRTAAKPSADLAPPPDDGIWRHPATRIEPSAPSSKGTGAFRISEMS